jgi:hypothetical protein
VAVVALKLVTVEAVEAVLVVSELERFLQH